MITETKKCPKCGSEHLMKNGKTSGGKQKFLCGDCRAAGTLEPTLRYREAEKEKILAAYQERPSLRGLERLFGVRYQTLSAWLKKKVENLVALWATLLPRKADDVLELDELWSFVESKENVFWVWLAICRRTRQVVGYFLGGREHEDCEELRAQLALSYRDCPTVSDGLVSYQEVFGDEHRSVGKETGETVHVERFNGTLRQRLARFVRKTLSFSKDAQMHHAHLRLFLQNYNLSRRAVLSS